MKHYSRYNLQKSIKLMFCLILLISQSNSEDDRMELSSVGDQVYAAERILKKRVKKVR